MCSDKFQIDLVSGNSFMSLPLVPDPLAVLSRCACRVLGRYKMFRRQPRTKRPTLRETTQPPPLFLCTQCLLYMYMVQTCYLKQGPLHNMFTEFVYFSDADHFSGYSRVATYWGHVRFMIRTPLRRMELDLSKSGNITLVAFDVTSV